MGSSRTGHPYDKNQNQYSNKSKLPRYILSEYTKVLTLYCQSQVDSPKFRCLHEKSSANLITIKSMRIKDNMTNKTSYKFKGLLVYHLTTKGSCQSFKTNPLHEQFGEKWPQKRKAERRLLPWMCSGWAGGGRRGLGWGFCIVSVTLSG